MRLFFTCGDPHSINLEGFLRTIYLHCHKSVTLIGIGSFDQLKFQARHLSIDISQLKLIHDMNEANGSGAYWLDVSSPTKSQKDPSQWTPYEKGMLARRALELIPKKSSKPMAVITGPIHKKNMNEAGFSFPGQTEFFENHWQGKAVMLLAGSRLRVGLVTNHLSLKDVPSYLTQNLVADKIEILHRGLKSILGIKNPRIAVCGLNPHASDDGLFGDEEKKIIRPAVEVCQQKNIAVEGPFPADTVFYQSLKGKSDAVLAMYHDQGLAPLKTVHFDDAVNISLGLAHLRISPDHGPASDLYLTGQASLESFKMACELANQYLLAESQSPKE